MLLFLKLITLGFTLRKKKLFVKKVLKNIFRRALLTVKKPSCIIQPVLERESSLKRRAIALSFLTLLSYAGVSSDKTESPLGSSISTCEQSSRWQFVYKPERLIPHEPEPCVVGITGVIVAKSFSPDGDEVLLVALDPPFNYLLNEQNYKEKGGNLVVEAICQKPKGHDYCNGYTDKLHIPPEGSRISFAGWWVTDIGGFDLSFVHDPDKGKGHEEVHPLEFIIDISNQKYQPA